MFNITISNHPVFPEITRKVKMLTLKFDESQNKINIEMRVNHFIGEIPILDLDRSIDLELDNGRQYPDGQGGFIGDYDYFYAMAEAGAGLKDLIDGGMNNVDNEGIINAKCNYK